MLEKIFQYAGHPLKLMRITDLPDINVDKQQV